MKSKSFIAVTSGALVAVGLGVAYLLVPYGLKSSAPVTAPTLVQDGTSNQSPFGDGSGFKSGITVVPTVTKEVTSAGRQELGKGMGASTLPSNQVPVASVSKQGTAPAEELSTASPTGERVIAKISNDGVERTLTPNEIGHFPRVYIKANQTVPVVLSFPDGSPEDPVVIQVEDGGAIDNGQVAKVNTLDEAKKLAFKFRSSADEGVYHVVLRKGGDVRVLDFWVGQELPLAKR